ncbi:ATP-binding protein [Nitrincola sp.]|uniref:ATP-binding protein n=1 Tax=Nitrincola sp. TaxID=1926584 RepID=UPI003A8D8059
MLSGSGLRLVRILLLGYLISSASCVVAQTHTSSNSTELEPLIIAQDRAWPPFAFVGENGEPRGLLIELWREIAAQMGRPVEFYLVDWPDSIRAVTEGRAHLHGGLFASEDRAVFMQFSEAIMPLSGYLFAPSGGPLTGFDDLRDKPIGVTDGSYEMEYIQHHYPDQPIRAYRSNELVVMAALAGEVAAYLADYPVSMYLLDRHGHPSNFHPLVQLYTQNLVAGVALGDEQLLQEINQAIQQLDQDFLSQLSYRWLRSELVVEVVPRWFVALLVVTILLLVLAAYTLFLSRQRREIQQLVSIQNQALQENEHLFQRLIENANDIIYIISADATIGYLSGEWVNVTGYSLEEAVGQPFAKYVHPQDLPFLAECHEHTLKGGRLSGIAFRLVDVRGQVHDMIANESSALDAQGEVTYYMGIARDITEPKRIEAEMERRRELLEDVKVKLEKEIGERSRIARDLEMAQARVARALEEEQKVTVAQKQFLRIVTHEFRTPLAVIQSLGDLLELEVSNDPQVRQKHISRLKTAVQRMANLLNKALDQERVETTFWRTNAAWFDIKTLLQELVGEAERLNGDSRHFTINAMSRRMQADRELLIICINNLLDNAVKFSPDQSEIFISAYMDEQNRVCISVTDQGKGVNEQDRFKIFGKYYRRNAQTNPGLGLGLYLVDQIIRLHGGDVVVTNAADAGACFILRIPA